MPCDEIQQLLRHSRGRVTALPQSGRNHLKVCGVCTAFAEDVEFAHLLQVDRVLPPSEGFTDRVLQQAWHHRDRDDDRERFRKAGMLAVAACLVLATGVALQSLWTGRETDPNPTGQQNVHVTPHQVSNVDLLLVSAQDLPQATIMLRMDDNVILAGYGSNRELQWPASLITGNNQLTLPVQLQGETSGSISVQVEAGGASKEMVLTVESAQAQRAALFTI